MLPKHVNFARCVPDPHGRANHILHPATRRHPEEVFHVDAETARKVLLQSRQNIAKAALSTPVPARVIQPEPQETDDEPEDDLEDDDVEEAGDDGPDRAELVSMAETLGIEVPAHISEAELLKTIEAKIHAETENAEVA